MTAGSSPLCPWRHLLARKGGPEAYLFRQEPGNGADPEAAGGVTVTNPRCSSPQVASREAARLADRFWREKTAWTCQSTLQTSQSVSDFRKHRVLRKTWGDAPARVGLLGHTGWSACRWPTRLEDPAGPKVTPLQVTAPAPSLLSLEYGPVLESPCPHAICAVLRGAAWCPHLLPCTVSTGWVLPSPTVQGERLREDEVRATPVCAHLVPFPLLVSRVLSVHQLCQGRVCFPGRQQRCVFRRETALGSALCRGHGVHPSLRVRPVCLSV